MYSLLLLLPEIDYPISWGKSKAGALESRGSNGLLVREIAVNKELSSVLGRLRSDN